jgi:hypothetical protein
MLIAPSSNYSRFRPCPQAKNVHSIVFVHGLNGHPKDTWTHPTTHFFWPWEVQKHIEGVRTLVYGYDADISPQFGTNLIRIKALAAGFLSSLVNERQEDNVSQTAPLYY